MYNPRLWYLGKIPFANEVFREAAAEVVSASRGLRGQSRKLIILDLDEVVWGGVVGEEGWEHLRLGGHDPTGEALVDFQRELKVLTRRGVILGIVSKNTEANALAALDNHPEMLLRRSDFAGWRINWNDKAANVAELLETLNLPSSAALFIDDNPVERSRVQSAFPDLLCPTGRKTNASIRPRFSRWTVSTQRSSARKTSAAPRCMRRNANEREGV